MGVDHPGLGMSLGDLQRMVRREAVAALQNSSIGRAGLRFYAGGKALFQGGGGVEIQDSGYIIIDGDLTGAGDFNWTGLFNQEGTSTFTGPTVFTGTINATGNTAWSGSMSILGDLFVLSGGRIQAGAVTISPAAGGQVQVGTITIDGGGSAGGQIVSSSRLELSGANGVRVLGTLQASDLIVFNKILASELDVTGAKNFKMPHPTKPGYWLRHGSTESPVSGTEYTGRLVLDADGVGTIELPEYFEALNKPANRTVQVTPIGRPFLVGADPVEGGRVTVYGAPGREVFWLVKAERVGGDFLLEEEADLAED